MTTTYAILLEASDALTTQAIQVAHMQTSTMSEELKAQVLAASMQDMLEAYKRQVVFSV